MSAKQLPQKLHRLEYQQDWAEKRLKQIIQEALPDLGSRGSFLVIRNGLVMSEGALKPELDADAPVPEGKALLVDYRHGVHGQGTPSHDPLHKRMEVKYDDEHVVVVLKRPFTLVQPVDDDVVPKGIQAGPPIVEMLKHYWKAAGKQSVNPIIVQRLDLQTSGLLVLAKTPQAGRELQRQLKPPRIMKREYLAIAAGQFRQTEGIWRTHLGYGKVGLRQSLFESGQKPPPRSEVQYAETHYKVLEVLEDATFLQLRLETGRTHQIRIHCAEAGHPLLGDDVYGRLGKITMDRLAKQKLKIIADDHPGQEAKLLLKDGELEVKKPGLKAKRVCLHATALTFTHPITGERMEFREGLPPDMEGYLKTLRRTSRKEPPQRKAAPPPKEAPEKKKRRGKPAEGRKERE